MLVLLMRLESILAATYRGHGQEPVGGSGQAGPIGGKRLYRVQAGTAMADPVAVKVCQGVAQPLFEIVVDMVVSQ